MESKSKTIVVGITGSIGSGKTTVARYFESLGYSVIYLDDISKKLMLENPSVKKGLIEEFGNEVFSDLGELNTSLISNSVFNPEDTEGIALTRLNKIVHPPTIDEMIERVEVLEKKSEKIIFVESALIFEAELDEGFDYIITVFTTPELAIERTIYRTGLAKQDIELRMKFQMSNEQKAGLSDFVLENNSDLQKLYQAADFVINILELTAG